MKNRVLRTIMVLCIAAICGISTLHAQEQQEKKIAYNFINEYGFFLDPNIFKQCPTVKDVFEAVKANKK